MAATHTRLPLPTFLSVALLACASAPTPSRLSSPNGGDTTSTASPTAADPAPLREPGTVAPFDRGAAARALSLVDVASCATRGGPTGPGHVTLVMANDGGVSSVRVDRAPYEDTIVGECIAEKFRGVRVPAFEGPPVPIGKSFVLE
jgi:hypothetical protein